MNKIARAVGVEESRLRSIRDVDPGDIIGDNSMPQHERRRDREFPSPFEPEFRRKVLDADDTKEVLEILNTIPSGISITDITIEPLDITKRPLKTVPPSFSGRMDPESGQLLSDLPAKDENITQLKEQIAYLPTQIETSQQPVAFVNQAVKLAQEAAISGDFISISEKLSDHYLFARDVKRELERTIRRILSENNGSKTLYELINDARDKGIITPDAAALAHLIQKQRNLFEYTDVKSHTVWTRCLLTLFAAALLWRELTDAANNNVNQSGNSTE